jgi:hypothetical protein
MYSFRLLKSSREPNQQVPDGFRVPPLVLANFGHGLPNLIIVAGRTDQSGKQAGVPEDLPPLQDWSWASDKQPDGLFFQPLRAVAIGTLDEHKISANRLGIAGLYTSNQHPHKVFNVLRRRGEIGNDRAATIRLASQVTMSRE